MDQPGPATAAALDIRPLAPGIGAEIRGLDLAQPMSDAVFAEIERAWHRHNVLLFRDQSLTEEQEVDFGGRFGPLAQRINKVPTGHVKHPSVMLISNVRENGELIGALPDGE